MIELKFYILFPMVIVRARCKEASFTYRECRTRALNKEMTPRAIRGRCSKNQQIYSLVYSIECSGIHHL